MQATSQLLRKIILFILAWLSALNGLAIALAPSWICFMLTECRFRYYVPVNVICSLPEFRFAEMSCFATPASASSIRPQIRSADNPLSYP